MSPLEILRSYPPHDYSVASILSSRAQHDRERPFLLFEGRTLSWGEIETASAKVAGAFAGLGVKPGDRVATLASNRSDIVIAFFALARLGAWLVPVNPELQAEEARYIFEHAGVCGIACAHETAKLAQAASAHMTPAPWHVLLEQSGEQSLAALATRAPPLAAQHGRADDVCVLIYTSGTTGFPKGVMHSQRNIIMAGEAFVERLRLRPDDRLLVVLPLFHINALFYSLFGAVTAGASLVLTPRFSASRFWQLAADTGATQVNIIAAVGNILAQRPRSEFVPHAIRKLYGGPITPEVECVFREEFGVSVALEGYGMTEIPGACNNPFPGAGLGEMRVGSIGKAARHPDPTVKFVELRVVDDAGQDLPDDTVGELAVRTPIVMKGYYRDPAATQAAFRDGWFLTGDLVRRDRDGYVWFVARKKDIIRRRGENISGAELDRIVGLHPDVAEAAAIPVASALGEDDILIAIVARPATQPTAASIATWCKERLAAHKQPRYVVFVDELPHTPTHRVAKFKLRSDQTLLERAVDLAAP